MIAINLMLIDKITQHKLFRDSWNNAGKDVVVLHMFWRGKHSPGMSPFVIKVETFLRMFNIKYIVRKINDFYVLIP